MLKEIMSTKVTKVREDMLVSELTSLLLSKGYSGAPVVDRKGKLVGVVSLADIAAYALTLRASRYPEEEVADGFIVEEFDLSTRVRDIMTPAVYRVEDTTPIQDVARLMLEGAIHRVIVVRQGKAVGILTTTDLVRAIPQLVH